MGQYYTYLISSLPALQFNAKPPFSREDFLAKCKGLVSERELAVLSGICRGESGFPGQAEAKGTLGKWTRFETILRNELVRARASRKKADPSRFLRQPDDFDAQIGHLAMAAYRNSSILDAEKMLDQARWDFLESVLSGHYFDFDVLAAYVLKLKILERWDNLLKADKESLFNWAIAN